MNQEQAVGRKRSISPSLRRALNHINPLLLLLLLLWPDIIAFEPNTSERVAFSCIYLRVITVEIMLL